MSVFVLIVFVLLFVAFVYFVVWNDLERESWFPTIKLQPELRKEYRERVLGKRNDYRRFKKIRKELSKLKTSSLEDELKRRKLDKEQTSLGAWDKNYFIPDRMLDRLQREFSERNERLLVEKAKNEKKEAELARALLSKRLYESGTIIKAWVYLHPDKESHLDETTPAHIVERRLVELDGENWLVAFRKDSGSNNSKYSAYTADNQVQLENIYTLIREMTGQEMMNVEDIVYVTKTLSQLSLQELNDLKDQELLVS